jgi:hypothetical protein
MRHIVQTGWLLLLSILSPGVLNADLFWKVAADAPYAPQITSILGDDRRTIAFGYGKTWEYDGAGWLEPRQLREVERGPG